MIKYTLAAAAVITLLSGAAQAELSNFDGLTVSGSVVGQSINLDGDKKINGEDSMLSNGFGVQFDYSVNKIVGVTGGYTKTSLDDSNFKNVDTDTERFYSGVNLGYRFEGQQWAVKPFGAIGFNTIEYKSSTTSSSETYNKVYVGTGAAVSYKQLTATLETDASALEDDVIFVESRLTLGYRF
ncbi:outer membrane beta-barrel protein [Vibrio ziniensis]|uniref:Porin family protein n=1 Tax=Vibrio ziniensis TaxID=2711221 RepID=A0A6G7CLM2_9VIBR|nr:outer membrane beta-barrel protein [Vibrio ziniensis]QIH43027.1 porin family protein [Vibrio ziniensis]